MERAKICDVASFIRGVSYKKQQAEKERKLNYLPLLRANNIFEGKLILNDLVFVPRELVSDSQHIKSGDIIITMSSGSKAHVGKVAIATSNMECTFGAFCGKISPHHILPTYLFYLLLDSRFRQHIEIQSKGTNINNLKQSYIMEYEIPIPPFSEQARIVARIEELFSQLDAGVETLKKTKGQLAVYRQAVLKEAFGSFLEKRPICEMSSIVTSGSRGWAKYYADKGARFIRITDLTRDRIGLKDDSIQYVDLPDNTEGKRSRLSADDVLISITADLGSIALVPQNIPEAYINQHIAVVRLKNPKQGKFMSWYLKSEYGQKDLLKNKRGGGKLGLGLDDIRDTPVPVVDNKTADVVVAQIDSRLSVCDSIEQTVDAALQQAEALRQSILKQVFEGELFDGTIQRI